MDHAAAHERIEDLLLEPARLAALERSTDVRDVALRDHLATCGTCAADLDAWRRLQAAIARSLPTDASPAETAAAVEPIGVPPSLRARVIAAVRDPDRPGAPVSISAPRSDGPRERAPRRGVGPWLALAASFLVLVGAGVLAVDQVAQRATAEAHARDLASALAIVDRMLGTEHKVVGLRTTAGQPAGTISWSRHDWVVLTTALPEPPADREYLCWLETDGRSVAIGRMELAGSTAYWVASLDEWQTWEMGPTTRFVVSLEQVGAETRTGPAILEAPLAG